MIEYRGTIEGITPDMLSDFFEGWSKPLTPEQHLKVLENSDVVFIAVDPDAGRVVGFITALTDNVQAAFIPLLEVIPPYRGQDIGSELVRRMLQQFEGIQSIDLTCDPHLQPFYAKFGMQPSVGMIVRNYK